MEQLLKAKELAEKLSVSVETVRRWTRDGVVPHVAIGQSKRYDMAKVIAALESTGGAK